MCLAAHTTKYLEGLKSQSRGSFPGCFGKYTLPFSECGDFFMQVRVLGDGLMNHSPPALSVFEEEISSSTAILPFRISLRWLSKLR